jgi:hypothetical protein
MYRSGKEAVRPGTPESIGRTRSDSAASWSCGRFCGYNVAKELTRRSNAVKGQEKPSLAISSLNENVPCRVDLLLARLARDDGGSNPRCVG